MPQIEIEDGVLNVEDYNGVRIKAAIFPLILAVIGGGLLALEVFKPGQGWFQFGGVVVAISLGLIFFTRSAVLQIFKGGKWESVGKYRVFKAHKLKDFLISEMN